MPTKAPTQNSRESPLPVSPLLKQKNKMLSSPPLNLPLSHSMETLYSLSSSFFIFFFILPILTGGDPIHDLLKSHGLPPGLLPKTVANFTFDPSTSILEAHLEKPCYAKYDSLAYFDRVVTGNLSYGQLKGVDGLKQEELFVWLPVKGFFNTNPGSGVIMIDIGLAHKQLSMSLFETPPDCRPEGALEGLGRKGGIQEQR